MTKAYRQAHLAQCRAKNIKWQQENWLYRQEYMRKYYAANRQKIIQRTATNYKSNRQEHLQQQKTYRKANAERIAKFQSDYRLKNWPKILENHRRWRNKNRAKWKAMSQRRRALERQATINLRSIESWMKQVHSKPSVICYWCSERIPISEVHFDHIVPIIKGGPHCVENLCVSCDKCNLKKGHKLLRLWVRTGQQILEL